MARVLPIIAGQPWELNLALESWRNGLYNYIIINKPAGFDMVDPCPERMGPCDADWLEVRSALGAWVSVTSKCSGAAMILEGVGNHYVYTAFIDPETGHPIPVIQFRGTPTDEDVGFYHVKIQASAQAVITNWDDVITFVLSVTPSSAASLGQGVTIPSSAADSFRALPAPYLHNAVSIAPIRSPCIPYPVGPGPGPITPPGPGYPGDCGQTTVFMCDGSELRYCNNILNMVWNAAGQPSDWEEMAWYIGVMTGEGGDENAGGDCCPNEHLDCTRCITCAGSSAPTTCCCSFGLFQLNRCGGQGGDHGCAELLDPYTNTTIAMIAMRKAWHDNKALGYIGQDLYRRAAADSGHPGASPSGEASRQAIADYTQCIFSAGALTFPLGTFGLVWPLHGALNADCAWHMASRENLSAIDINCGGGETIKAAHSGTVTFAGLDPTTAAESSKGYGWMVKIEDAAYPEYETRYGHMQAGSLLVSTGDHVTGGATGLGLCGSTGNSTGPHLHFELRHNGVTLCPCVYLTGGC